MKINNFFLELKRRNVYKVAVAYAVVAWLLIQAASIFFPAFDAPPWVMKIFIIVIVFGFPVALIFSWAFEITPEGIKLESEIEPNKSIKLRSGRKIVAVTIALGVVAAGLFVYQLVLQRSITTPTASAARTEASTVAPNKSIAVLPFVNMSAEHPVLRSKAKTKRTSFIKSAISCTLARCWKEACAKPAISCASPLS